jgi:hypothetical protein
MRLNLAYRWFCPLRLIALLGSVISNLDDL